MTGKKLGRREFLKLAIAAVGAAGLSHFEILNIGGADVALAQVDDCTNDAAGGSTDTCSPLQGGSGDTCPEPLIQDNDICNDIEDSTDYCNPDAGEPDVCLAGFSPDVCDPQDPLAPDLCPAGAGQPGDVCEVGPPADDPDSCDPVGPPIDPDVCERPGNDDTCNPPDPAGDGDICLDDAADYCYDAGGEDTCAETPPQTPDICDPGAGDPDSPNPVTLGSVAAESASSALPALGGIAAAAGAAALWLRHRLRPKKSEEPKTE